MEPNYQFPTGWHKDMEAVQETLQQWDEQGLASRASAFSARSNPSLKGNWERLKANGVVGVFLSDTSRRVNGGKPRRPFLQEHGTCVDRGCTRGVQLSTDFSIVNKASLSRPVTIQFGSTYIGARGDIGGNRLRGEGAILGQAMTCLNQIGCLEIGLKLGKYDLARMSEQEIENLVVSLSNGKLPPEWVSVMRGHVVDTFWCDELTWIFDCVSAGYACPYAFDYVTGAPNKYGLSGLGSYGPHCRCFSGVYVDHTGRDQLVSAESWGRFPAGNPSTSDRTMDTSEMPCITITLGDGSQKVLCPGEVGVNAEAFAQGIYHDGEVYAVGAAKGFEPDSLSDLLKKKVA